MPAGDLFLYEVWPVTDAHLPVIGGDTIRKVLAEVLADVLDVGDASQVDRLQYANLLSLASHCRVAQTEVIGATLQQRNNGRLAGRGGAHLLYSGLRVVSLKLLHHVAAHPVRVVLHHRGAAAAAPTCRLARRATGLERRSQDREPGRGARALEKQPSSGQHSPSAGHAFLCCLRHVNLPATALTLTARDTARFRVLSRLASSPSSALAR